MRRLPKNLCPLALLLLMLGIFADNHNMSLALDDLALLADHLYGRSYLHRCSSFRNYDLLRQVIRPLVRSYGDNSMVTLSPG